MSNFIFFSNCAVFLLVNLSLRKLREKAAIGLYVQ